MSHLAVEQVNADNALDLWAYLIVGIPAFISAAAAAVIGFMSARSRKASDAKLEEVREQVSNTHDTNMRDDIDAIRTAITHNHKEVRDRLDYQSNDIRGIRQDIGELRATDRQDREDGNAAHAELREAIADLKKGQP